MSRPRLKTTTSLRMAGRCRTARRELRLSQAKLAAALGCSEANVQHVEAERQRPSHAHLLWLAQMTGRSVAWFYGEETRRPRADGSPAFRERMALLLFEAGAAHGATQKATVRAVELASNILYELGVLS